MLDTKCQLRQIGEYVNTYYVSFAMRKQHPLFDQLADAMRKLTDDGSIAQILHSYPELSGQCKARGTTPFSKSRMQLSVTELKGLFVIVGIVLALAVLWEVLMNIYLRVQLRYSTQKINSLA